MGADWADWDGFSHHRPESGSTSVPSQNTSAFARPTRPTRPTREWLHSGRVGRVGLSCCRHILMASLHCRRAHRGRQTSQNGRRLRHRRGPRSGDALRRSVDGRRPPPSPGCARGRVGRGVAGHLVKRIFGFQACTVCLPQIDNRRTRAPYQLQKNRGSWGQFYGQGGVPQPRHRSLPHLTTPAHRSKLPFGFPVAIATRRG